MIEASGSRLLMAGPSFKEEIAVCGCDEVPYILLTVDWARVCSATLLAVNGDLFWKVKELRRDP